MVEQLFQMVVVLCVVLAIMLTVCSYLFIELRRTKKENAQMLEYLKDSAILYRRQTKNHNLESSAITGVHVKPAPKDLN